MTTPVLDQSKSEAFAGKMIGILNSASLALMTSIGHQTNLFEVLSELPARPARRSPKRRG